MKKNILDIGLRAKILAGNCIPLILVIAIGFMSASSLNKLLNSNQWVDHTHRVIGSAKGILEAAINMETGMRGYLLAGKEEFLEPYNAGQENFFETIAALQKTVDDNPPQVKLLGDIRDTINEWITNITTPQIELRRAIGNGKAMQDISQLVAEERGKKYFDEIRRMLALVQEREYALMDIRKNKLNTSTDTSEFRDALAWVNHTHEVIADTKDLLATAIDMETGMRGYLLAGQEQFLEPFNWGSKAFRENIIKLKKKVDDNPTQVATLEEIRLLVEQWLADVCQPNIELRREIGNSKAMQDIASLVGEARGKKYFDKFRGMLSTFIEREQSLMEIRKEEAEGTQLIAENTLIYGILIAVVVSIIIALLLANGILKRFKRIFGGLTSFSNAELSQLGSTFNQMIKGLSNNADSVYSASNELRASSHQLADGAQEQAASIEEVSSTLEEIDSITKQTSENAEHASGLSLKAESAALDGKAAMTKMSEAIDDMSDAVGRIKASSDKTAKVIKTIDEIAFQTNILALNAAVEAARAGDAGSGFAVVAEEVRNLAQSSAQAALETAALIDESGKDAESGVNYTEKVSELLQNVINENIDPIVEGIQEVNQINQEVANASNEQKDGVEQINTTVANMSDLTQQNASSSEESSAASEELAKQAEALKSLVNELSEVTSGVSNELDLENTDKLLLDIKE